MKALVFDTGPIIALTLNNLLWLIPALKKKYQGKFYITKGVREELIDYPLKTKKFKFEAFQVLKLIRQGDLHVYDSSYVRKKSHELLDLANSSYSVRGRFLSMLHYAEISALAATIELRADALVVDERMTRLFLENPSKVEEIIAKRYHSEPHTNNTTITKFRKEAKSVRVLRSTELVTIGYEFGLFNDYIARTSLIPYPRQQLLDALLWGLKLNGCAIAEQEIKQILKVERNR